jgi:hypothetical protein
MVTETFVFKSEKLPIIYQDYFSIDKMEQRITTKNAFKAAKISDVLIERDYHYCKIKDLTQNIAALYF